MNRQPRQLKIQGSDMQIDMVLMGSGFRVQGDCGSFPGGTYNIKVIRGPYLWKVPFGPTLA